MGAVLDHPMRWATSIGGVDALVLLSEQRPDRRGLSVVVFDGDDTLWETEPLYDDARNLAAQAVAGAGLDVGEFQALQRERDLANVARFGLSAERFPTSSVEAFVELANRNGLTPTGEQVATVRAAAESVFDAVAPVSGAARPTLRALRPTFRLILLTQGDPRVQAKRVRDSGLSSFFDEIVVVAQKSTAVISAVVDRFDIPHSGSWMVGNSLPSDVNPAIAAGMRAIWIDAHVWDHERREVLAESDRVVVASDLAEVPAIVSGATK